MLRVSVAVFALVASLLACAHEAPVEVRVLVKLVTPAAPQAVVAQVGRSAGVPARYIAAVSPQWHALALSCRPAGCEAALQRLGADRAHIEAVQRDERRATP